MTVESNSLEKGKSREILVGVVPDNCRKCGYCSVDADCKRRCGGVDNSPQIWDKEFFAYRPQWCPLRLAKSESGGKVKTEQSNLFGEGA